MNQTESGRKAEGAGVGILCETRPAASVRSAASASGEPRLRLRTYLAAPDGLAVVVTEVELNQPAGAAKNLRANRKSLTLPERNASVYGRQEQPVV